MPVKQNVKDLTVIHNVTVCRIEYKTPKRIPDLKVPAIRLPTADDKIRRKVKVHITCVMIGGLISVLVAFVGGDVGHYATFLPAVPNAFYEFLDRIANR